MSMNLKVVRIKSKLEEMYNNKIDITDIVLLCNKIFN